MEKLGGKAASEGPSVGIVSIYGNLTLAKAWMSHFDSSDSLIITYHLLLLHIILNFVLITFIRTLVFFFWYFS